MLGNIYEAKALYGKPICINNLITASVLYVFLRLVHIVTTIKFSQFVKWI